MKKPDYERFLDITSSELPDGYVVTSPYTEVEWGEQFARITNAHSNKLKEFFR